VSAFSTSLEPLLAVATATMDEHGILIEANAGFLRVLNLAKTPPPATSVEQFFIQPDFATLNRAPADRDGRVYRGLLTMSDNIGQARTLSARVWREGTHLLLLAEYDIEDLERLNRTVLDLNRDYAQAQIELAQVNLKLRATNIQLKEAQKKLVEAEKMAALGILVAGVAHEVNTPLGVGLAAASTLQDKSEQLAERFAASRMTHSDMAHYLDTARTSTGLINQNLERIGHLIESFRQVAVEGKSLPKRLFRLRDCLDEVIRSFGSRLPAERISVRIDCAPDLEIESVSSDWASIFTNLIDNSLKHGFNGRGQGNIDICVARDAKGKALRVDYRDDGVGLTAAVQNRIFDPFFTTDLQRGFGLGMNLVYNLITHRMGGNIQIESSSGNGVHFRIEVPQ
jgi:signal transduction histidine kinase